VSQTGGSLAIQGGLDDDLGIDLGSDDLQKGNDC